MACSAVDLQKLQSENPEAAESLMTTGARPRLTQSYVQFSAGHGKSSARKSNGSARRSARRSPRKTERNSETKSGRRQSSANRSRGKHEQKKRPHASRTGSLDSGKASTKSGKRKRSTRKKSRRTLGKRSPSKASQLRQAGTESMIMKRNKGMRSHHSKHPSRNLQPYQTEVMNSKNSTIVH